METSVRRVNFVLADRIRESIGVNDEIVFATNRDIIVILPTLIRCTLWSLIGTLGAYSLSDWFRGSYAILAVGLMVLWGWFLLVPFLNYQYEILAFVKNVSGARALYRKGFWLKDCLPLKISSLVSTPVRQNKGLYQTLLRVGDLKLDAFGSDTDIFFNDCSDPFAALQVALDLQKESSGQRPPGITR